MAELNLAFSFPLHIVDGTRIMVEGGPWEGSARNTRLVLAAGDPVACDAVGLAIIKSFGRWERLADITPWQMRQLRHAVKIGLGAGSMDEMTILYESTDNDPSFEALAQSVRRLLA